MNKTRTNQPAQMSELTHDNLFQHGILECCNDCGMFMKAWCCYPCFVYSIFRSAKETCCAAFCAGIFAGFCPQCMHGVGGVLRSKLRAHFKIHGSLQEDACYSQMCPLFMMLQLHNELVAQGEANEGFFNK